MKKRLPLFFVLSACFYTGLAQQNNVGINTTTPDPSAALHIESTNQGVLVPRLTSGQREGISNTATGLLVFDTDTGSFWFYNGTAWVNLSTPDDDGDPTNELQALSYDPDTMILTLAGGGTVDLSGLVDADGDPMNELQDISIDGRALSLSKGSTVTLPNDLVDADGNTRIQVEETLNDNTIRFDVNGIEAMTLTPNGKLGVGTDNPQERVEVNGKVKATTFLGDGSQLTGLLPAGPQAGDITYYDGSAWQRIAKGPVGSVLRMGNNGMPEWAGGLLEVTLPNSEILYVHPTDNSTGNIWGDLTDITELPNITSTSEANMDYNGENNTQAIVGQLQNYNSGNYAAKLCADLVAFGFDDWYLPAAGELNMMYQQLGPTDNSFNGSGDITSGLYWSSSEVDDVDAWRQNFVNGDHGFDIYSSKAFLFRCRCVRR